MKNKYLIFILAVIFLAAILPGVYAITTVSLITPATSGTVTGVAQVLNVTITDTTGSDDALNCSIYAYSPSTANTPYTRIASVVNNSLNDTDFSTTWNSTAFEDSNDYSFYASCWTNLTSVNSSASTSVIIDNTVPTAPSALSLISLTTLPTTVNESWTETITSTVVDRETTGCTLYLLRNGVSSSYTMSYATTSCSYAHTFADSSYNDRYQYYIRASDGTNTTDSAVVTFDLALQQGDSSSGGWRSAEIANEANQKNQAGFLSVAGGNIQIGGINMPIFGIIAIIALLGLIGWAIFKK